MTISSTLMALGSLSLALVPTVAIRYRRRTQQAQNAHLTADRQVIDTAKRHASRSLMVGGRRLDSADFGCSLAFEEGSQRLSLVCLKDGLYDERIYKPHDLVSVRLDEDLSSGEQVVCSRLDLIVLVDDARRSEWRIVLLDGPQPVFSPTYRARRLHGQQWVGVLQAWIARF